MESCYVMLNSYQDTSAIWGAPDIQQKIFDEIVESGFEWIWRSILDWISTEHFSGRDQPLYGRNPVKLGVILKIQ